MSTNENPEAGLRNHRPEFVRESSFGATPDNPSILKYSHTVSTFSWSSDSVNEAQRGLGDEDPKDFLKGPETHEVSVEYDLVKWFSATGDAAYDGMARDSDQLLTSSHTILDREAKGTVNADQTINGSTSKSTRIYTVGRGALIDEVVVNGDPSDSQPVTIELTYLVQKARSYQIDQPASSTLLVVSSSNTNDTTQTLTIESEGAATTEDISLNGQSNVSTSSSFGDIDVLNLSAETEGDITVSVNDGTQTSPTVGDDLAVISGTGSYNGVEGDLGVPALGTGSREDVSTNAVEQFIGDVISRGGTQFPYEVNSASLTVSNNVGETERSSGYGMALHPGSRDTTLEVSMFGEAMTHDLLMQELQNTKKDITWQMDGGTITLPSAVLQSPGERAAETGQAVMTTDNEFESQGISFS